MKDEPMEMKDDPIEMTDAPMEIKDEPMEMKDEPMRTMRDEPMRHEPIASLSPTLATAEASVYDSRAATCRAVTRCRTINWRKEMPRGRPKKNTDDVLLKSAEVIGWALGGIEREISMTRERLASLTAQASSLRSRLSSSALPAAHPAAAGAAAGDDGNRKRRRRKMSPEARKRISEMMKKRWAERRKKQ
jgi:hypothetical protein